MLLFIVWLIQYTDLIEGKGCLTTTIPPITLHAAQHETIGRIYIRDHVVVASHTPVAEMKSALSEGAILHLNKWLPMVEKDLSKHYFPSERYRLMHHSYGEILGMIQETYNALQKHILEYIPLFQNDYHLSSCNHIKHQIESTHALLNLTKLQLSYAQRKMMQEKVKFQACKMISQVDFFQQESFMLQTEEDVANKKKSMVEYRIIVHNYQKQLKALTFQYQKK